MSLDLPTFADIRAAAGRIAPYAVRTPLVESPVLNARIGSRVLLKCETLQRIGAFKFRGAFNAISQIDRARFPGGVVAASSGNHAQGVAAAAALLGLPSAIVMPADAPRLKLERTRALGAHVVLFDRLKDDREAISRNLAAERRADFVHPFDDARVMAGQGTVGLEIAADARAAGVEIGPVLIPVSGGGLASGTALALQELAPRAHVHPIEPDGFDDWGRSLKSGQRERNTKLGGSICDALLIQTPGSRPFEIGTKLFGPGFTASDDEVRAAMRFAYEELKLVVEPGGAIGLAVLLSGRIKPDAGRACVVVLSGGNVDPADFSAIITA